MSPSNHSLVDEDEDTPVQNMLKYMSMLLAIFIDKINDQKHEAVFLFQINQAISALSEALEQVISTEFVSVVSGISTLTMSILSSIGSKYDELHSPVGVDEGATFVKLLKQIL